MDKKEFSDFFIRELFLINSYNLNAQDKLTLSIVLSYEVFLKEGGTYEQLKETILKKREVLQ